MIRPGTRFRFGGRLTRVGRPPLRWAAARQRPLAAVVLAAVLSGCFGGGQPLPSARPDAPLAPDARRLGDLAEALAEAETSAERLALTAAALRSAGVSPLADSDVPGEGGRYVAGAMGETLAGWIPGRVPVHLDSLVVIAAPRDGAADLALIEAARMLVARGAYTQTPARSVLVVLGDDVAAALRLWRRDAVIGAVVVGAPASMDVPGQPIQAVKPGPTVDLAARAYTALLEAATPPTLYARPASGARGRP